MEIELGWGYHDIDSSDRYRKLSKHREEETEALYRFLELLDEYNIPVSFDVVGHLFLDTCPGHHRGNYPEGWFWEDPGTNLEQDPLFYAPDLLNAISEAETDHEICTHTFSHVLCDEINEETLRDELELVQRLHREAYDKETVSLVTPRHRDVSRSVLKDCGIDILRVPTDDLPEGRLSRLYWYLFGDHPVEDLKVEQGITETYTSPAMSLTAYHLPTGQTQPHPVFRAIPKWFRRKLHERYLMRGLDRACEQDSNIHLWTHLHDIANESQWPAITSFLEELDEKISDREARSATMKDLSQEMSCNNEDL